MSTHPQLPVGWFEAAAAVPDRSVRHSYIIYEWRYSPSGLRQPAYRGGSQGPSAAPQRRRSLCPNMATDGLRFVPGLARLAGRLPPTWALGPTCGLAVKHVLSCSRSGVSVMGPCHGAGLLSCLW